LIPHSRPLITEDDVERVARVVRSGRLAQGPEVAALERELAARLGVEDAAAVASGTVALELALAALGVGTGDEVLIPTYVCDALHHAVRRVGAEPVLVDADPATHTLSPKDALARRTPRTRAVIVPHAFGLAAALEPFQALGVPVIEDCAQALGATAATGRPVGAAGTLAVCSFYATKMIAAGEGGAVAGPAALVARVREAREYDGRQTLAPRGNAKLTDVAAALARGQLARLDAFVARRRALAARYRARLAALPVRVPADAGARHVYHRFVLGLDRDPDAVAAALAARGVTARRPVFRPAHQALGLRGYPEAERLWAESLSIPCYPALGDDEAERVEQAVGAVLAAPARGGHAYPQGRHR
jgi:dTDP-4-amino-4,6-dideoxygalactose transaminase